MSSIRLKTSVGAVLHIFVLSGAERKSATPRYRSANIREETESSSYISARELAYTFGSTRCFISNLLLLLRNNCCNSETVPHASTLTRNLCSPIPGPTNQCSPARRAPILNELARSCSTLSQLAATFSVRIVGPNPPSCLSLETMESAGGQAPE